MSGQGKQYWAKSKNIYEGEWSQGLKSGVGSMVYGDKSTYTGQWFDDKRHGKGKMTII